MRLLLASLNGMVMQVPEVRQVLKATLRLKKTEGSLAETEVKVSRKLWFLLCYSIIQCEINN